LLQLADAATTIASGTSLGLGYSSLYFSIRKARPFFSKKARETKKSIEEILKEEKIQSKVLMYDSLLNELELKLLSK
jgi:hypothetical protein